MSDKVAGASEADGLNAANQHTEPIKSKGYVHHWAADGLIDRDKTKPCYCGKNSRREEEITRSAV